MTEQLKIEIAEIKKDLGHVSEKVVYLEDKKLSKHEFNGFAQLVENMKSTFLESIATLYKTSDQLGKNTSENTAAINSLQTTFSNIEKFLPKFIKLIAWGCGAIISLLIFIASMYAKQLGLL